MNEVADTPENPQITFEVISLFPEMFAAIERSGITRRALERGLWAVRHTNPRDFAGDAHRTVDDRPYGGGPGMVMMAEPLAQAIASCRARHATPVRVVHFSPAGERLNHLRVMELVSESVLVLLCGRYEGMDQRLIDREVDLEVSLGDFVLSGGELPAMALMDAVIRQLPGALNDSNSAVEDSFVGGLLDCPHYTRPEVWDNRPVPEVLLSGDHARIRRWRTEQSLRLTHERRPDLLATAGGAAKLKQS
nr:tRNA (guanosine(37)-N1)-methyltransferase TrmD [Methyloversatilis thermotolerans]